MITIRCSPPAVAPNAILTRSHHSHGSKTLTVSRRAHRIERMNMYVISVCYNFNVNCCPLFFFFQLFFYFLSFLFPSLFSPFFFIFFFMWDSPGGAGRLVMQQATGTGTGGFPPLPETFPPKRNTDYKLEEGQVEEYINVPFLVIFQHHLG